MNTPNSSKRYSGFSLLELSIMLFVFIALIAVAIPNLMEMLRANRLTGDARSLVRQLSLARQRAGADFTWTKIVIGSSSGAAGGQMTAAQTTTVIFNSRGIPIDNTGSPTATDTIYLADSLGNACAVSVTLSGHARGWRYASG